VSIHSRAVEIFALKCFGADNFMGKTDFDFGATSFIA